MEHTVTLRLNDDAYASLLRAGKSRQLPPETVATQLLTDSLADPLLSLFGSISFAPGDLSERHDEYIGEAIAAEIYRD